METTHGTWGNRRRIYQNDSCLVTLLELEPNRRCSWHYHKTFFNMFYVVSGCMGVKTDKGYRTKLHRGHSFVVEPGVTHEFQTYIEPATVIEIAYVQFNEHDIHRENLGGPNDEEMGR